MYDIVIIGSGPAGLSAAIYAQRENLKAVVVEKEFMGTGQIAESERVDNYPGLYGETGFDLGEKFRTHAEKLGAEFVEGEVTEVERVNGNFSVNICPGTLPHNGICQRMAVCPVPDSRPPRTRNMRPRSALRRRARTSL